jgi:hypothetical protein
MSQCAVENRQETSRFGGTRLDRDLSARVPGGSVPAGCRSGGEELPDRPFVHEPPVSSGGKRR